MPINSEASAQNLPTSLLQGVAASLATNLMIHPATTWQIHSMSGKPTTLNTLYRGFLVISLADTAANSIVYGAESYTKNNSENMWPLIIGRIASGIIVAYGEGVMISRQIHNLRYSECFKRRFGLNEIPITLLRETLYLEATFRATPWLKEIVMQQAGVTNPSPLHDVGLTTISGIITGASIGVATAPVDLVKTRLQANVEPTTITKITEEIFARDGFKGFFRGALQRGFACGLCVASLAVINTAPSLFAQVKSRLQ